MRVTTPQVPDLPSLPKPAQIHPKAVELGVTDGTQLPKGIVYFKTMRDYENMALNMADILRYIKDSKAYIKQCR